ncbi:hypothetical protein ACH4PU_30775 [Streptomyces sp. NPDC021100]|uniref:hypothetical protein n=1 Tax=Streptomyces sp. NPDC021100 TaxID=3365114 RepID=UPI0037BD93DD
MPHTRNRAHLRACQDLLGFPLRSVPQTRTGQIHLDSGSPAQQRFQALLVTCLMSTEAHPHPWERPGATAMASITGYLNWIAVHPDRLDVHTNTACRIAARMLPLLHHRTHISGIPGLRLIGVGRRRLRLKHLPTGARLDLIDTQGTKAHPDLTPILDFETSWHIKPGTQPLWQLPELTTAEAAHAHHWAPSACTPLRAALMARTEAFYRRPLDCWPAWADAAPGQPNPRLVWTGGAEVQDVADVLTTSVIRIPGAAYQARGRDQGVLRLGDGAITLVRKEQDLEQLAKLLGVPHPGVAR